MTHSDSAPHAHTQTRRLIVQPHAQRAGLSVSTLDARHVDHCHIATATQARHATANMRRLTSLITLLAIVALMMMAAGALPMPLTLHLPSAAAAAAHEQPAAAEPLHALPVPDVMIQQLQSLPVSIPPDADDGPAAAPPPPPSPPPAAVDEAPLPAPAAAAVVADPPSPPPSRSEEQLDAPIQNDAVTPPTSDVSPATAAVDETAAVDAIAVADSAAAPPITEPVATPPDSAHTAPAPPDEPNSPAADSASQEGITVNSTDDAPAAAPPAAEPIDSAAAAAAPSLANGTVVVVELNGSVASTSGSGTSTSNGSVLVPIPAALSRLVNESSALNATVLAAVLANVSTAAVPVIVVAVPTPTVNTPLVATASSGSSASSESKEDIPRLDAYKQTVLDMVAEKKGKKIKKKEEEDAAAAVAAAAVGGATNGGGVAVPPVSSSTDSAPSTPDAAHTPSQPPPPQSSAPPDQVQVEPSHSVETAPEALPPVADVPAPVAPSHSSSIPRPPESDESDHDRDRFNYAAFDAGAKMLATSPGMKKASAILVADDDRYLMVPCNAPHKSFVIQLSEDIIIDTIELGNLEHYASSIRDFEILGSATHPTSNWLLLGSFTALDSAQKQVFTLPSREWVRFIKLRWTSHYGDEYYCTLTYLRVYGTTMLETFREEMQQSEVDVKEITREINNIKPLANKEDAAAAANGNGNSPVLAVPALPTPASGSTGAGTSAAASVGETKEGASSSPSVELQQPHEETDPARTATESVRLDGDHSAKPVAPSTDSAPSTLPTASPNDAACAAAAESTSPTSDGSTSMPTMSTTTSGPAAPASSSPSSGEPAVTAPSSHEDRAKFESELAKFTGRPQPPSPAPIGGSDNENGTNSTVAAAAATALSIPSAFVNKSLIATLLHEVATIDTVADVLIAADSHHHSDTPAQSQPTDSPAAPPALEGTSVHAPAETIDAEASATVQQAGTASPNGDTSSAGSVPAAPALPSEAAVPASDRTAAAPAPVVSKDDILPLPPLLKSSLGSSGSGGSSSGGGGQQSIFKALTNRIKELEIHQALASNYVSDLADRYVKDTAALRARIDAMSHDMAAHAARNEAQWSEGWAMMNRTAEYVQADSHRVMASVKEQLEEAQEFLALVESIIYLQLAVAICTALAYFLGRWVLSIVVGLQRLLCCMCVRRKRIVRHTYSKSSPNLLLTAQQLQELRDERQELVEVQPVKVTRRASPKLHLHALPLSPKRSPVQQYAPEHHERGPRVRAASIGVVQQQHHQQSSRLASGPRHGHSASAYSPRHLAGLNPRRASAAAGVSFDSIPQFDREAAYLWAERNGPHAHDSAVLSDEVIVDDDDTDTQKNSSVEVSEDERDRDNDNENDSEGEAEYERADSNEQRYLAHLIQQQQALLQQQAKAARRRQLRRMSAVDRSASSSPAASPARQHVRAATVDLAPSASTRRSRGGSFFSMLKSSLSPRTSMTQSAPPPSGLPSAAAVSVPAAHGLPSATVAFSSEPAAATVGMMRDRRAHTAPAPLLRSLLGGIVHGSMNLLSGRNRSHPHSAVADVAEEAESLNSSAGQSESAPPLAPPHQQSSSSTSPSSILRASPLQPLDPQDDDIAEEDPSGALAASLPPASHVAEAPFATAESFGAVPLPSSARSFSGSSNAASIAAAAMHFSSPRRALRSPNQFDLLASPAVPSPIKAHEGVSPTSSALAGVSVFGDKRGPTHSHGQRIKQR